MIGAAQKISAAAAAIALGLGVLTALHSNLAFAQNEPEPEATPIEEPHAEPTEWTPVTAGDAERGAPAASPEAAPSPVIESMPAHSPTPAETASPAQAPSPVTTPSSSPASAETPAATRSPSKHTTISRERSRSRRIKPTASMSPTPSVSPSTGASSTEAGKARTAGGGPQIVPENSPFAGMNFGNQKGPTNIKSDSLNLDYQNKAILFTGHVHAVQAGGDLTSDTLKVQYGQDFNDIKMMYADGNVRMSQGTRWITSDHAVLDQTKHLLTFHGNPVAHDGEDQITGSTIRVDLVSGKSTVENPRVVIFPRESKNPDNVNSPDSQ
jgi:lipopolysaccharide transport protein LptA